MFFLIHSSIFKKKYAFFTTDIKKKPREGRISQKN